MNIALVFAILAALAIGGLALAFLGGDDAASKRRQALSKPTRKVANATADRAAKKKQIADSLAELEKKTKGRKADLQTRIEQAGLSLRKTQFLIIFAGLGLVAGGLTYFKSENAIVGALVAI